MQLVIMAKYQQEHKRNKKTKIKKHYKVNGTIKTSSQVYKTDFFLKLQKNNNRRTDWQF